LNSHYAIGMTAEVVSTPNFPTCYWCNCASLFPSYSQIGLTSCCFGGAFMRRPLVTPPLFPTPGLIQPEFVGGEPGHRGGGVHTSQLATRELFALSLRGDGECRRVPRRPFVGSGPLYSPLQRSICSRRCKPHFGRLQGSIVSYRLYLSTE